MAYKINVQPEVRSDIQEGIDWYNEQENGLGIQFFSSVETHFRKLQSNPFYQVRYDDVRCMPMKRFPYMIHFTVDEAQKLVKVHGVIGTLRDPKIWEERK
ncbi:hypothetical protein [Rhodohalobacter sp. 8-1]|uniref:hypothetical protein n=1 Tax=Rhodohalobacter sp. 8-1 TaxID=3131972 RepID=UPI0030EF720A